MTVFGYNDSATILQYVLYIRVVGTVEHPATTAPMQVAPSFVVPVHSIMEEELKTV